MEVPTGLELPLFHKDDPPERHVQQIGKVQVRLFHLDKPEELAAYEKVWQLLDDKHAVLAEHRLEYGAGGYLALLRWRQYEYKLPAP